MSDSKLSTRKEIPNNYKWNNISVFPDFQAWEEEVKSILSEIQDFTQLKNKSKDNPKSLANTLKVRDDILRRVDIVFMYAFMSHEVDKTNQLTVSLVSKAQGLLGQARAAASFVEPEILQIGRSKINSWITQNDDLKIYSHYFDDIFRKSDHVRSEEVEELLGMLSDPFSSTSITAGILTDADFKFNPAVGSSGEELELSQGSLDKIYVSPDRVARRTAWLSYTDTYLGYKNTLANNLTTSIKQNIFNMKARNHRTTLEASLFENNIPVDVFYNLIETFQKNLTTWHRYFEIRRNALGVDQLHPYDMWAPLSKKPPKIAYNQAVDWICDGLRPMGEDYVNAIKNGCLQERWVDIYPNIGKTSGAFSFGSYRTYPFIVMSYTDDIFSLSTLAHELGHSMHSYLAWENQPYIYSDYSLFLAEVASNFHQAMVRAYLLDAIPDRDFQISVIEEAMANFFRYFFIMPSLARFELATHQQIENGEGVNAEGMISLMADIFSEAYGNSVYIDRERVGITWATFSHLYEDYYVYQYSTGISGAHTLSNRILSGEREAVNNYLEFLKAGGSMHPLDALKLAGCDLASPEPVEETFAILSDMVERLENLVS